MKFTPKTAGIVAASAVLATTAGVVVVHQVSQKDVQITADGQTSEVRTTGSTVGDALKAGGISLGEHDSVVPDQSSKIQDGTHIAVGYGRPLTMTINGQKQVVWTTATTLDEALDQLGISDAAKLSVSRSTVLGRDGLSVDAITPKRVQLSVGGKPATTVESTATTLDGFIGEQKLTLNPKDVVKPSLSTPVTDGMKVTIDRVIVVQQKLTLVIKHKTVLTNDPTAAEGTRSVTRKGVDGHTDQVMEITVVNNKKQPPKVVSSLTTEPVDEQVSVGQLPKVAAAKPSATATTTPSAAPKSTPTSTAGLNTADEAMWDRIAECESSQRWNLNDGSGYYGGLQFDQSTWESVNGTKFAPRADLATKAQQIDRANALRAQRGLQPWACAHAA